MDRGHRDNIDFITDDESIRNRIVNLGENSGKKCNDAK